MCSMILCLALVELRLPHRRERAEVQRVREDHAEHREDERFGGRHVYSRAARVRPRVQRRAVLASYVQRPDKRGLRVRS